MPPKVETKEKTPTIRPQRFYAPTDLTPIMKVIKNRIGSGIPIGTPTVVFGAPKAGKSTLCTQLAVERAIQDGGHAAVHDTELNHHLYMDLAMRLSERFDEKITTIPIKVGVISRKPTKEEQEQNPDAETKFDATFEYRAEVPKDGTNLFVLQCPEMALVTHMYGHGMNVEVSKGGKVVAELVKDAWIAEPKETPLGKFFAKQNIKAFVLDSVTNPLDKIPAVTKNFPGRSDLTQAWMIQILNLAWEFEIPAFVIAHESRNEASVGSQGLDVEGGKGIDYNAKHVLYMLKTNSQGLLPGVAKRPDKKLTDTGRWLYGARIPGNTDWCGPAALDLTDTGFIAFD